MARSYSQDVRARVIAAVAAGSSARAAGRLFGVSASTASKWVQQLPRTSSVAANSKGRNKRPPQDIRVKLLQSLIDEHPDLTVEEFRTWLETRRTRAANGSERRLSARHEISSKKPRASGFVAKKQNFLLFGLESRASARHAAYFGLIAAIVVFGFSIFQVFKVFIGSGIDPSENWVVFATILTFLGLQFVALIGIYFYSRIAAFSLFVIFATQALAVYWMDGIQSPVVTIAVIVLLLAFIQGIRGTIAYHRHHKYAGYRILR